jgi:cell division initiation protein
MTAAIQHPQHRRMSPAKVRSMEFSVRRRGYDQDEVDAFLRRLAGEVEASDADRAALRAELDRRAAELSRLRSEAVPDEQGERLQVSTHAVSLLSQAQQAADSAVAEAERYSQDLVAAARDQYQDILQRAQQAASEAVRDLRVVEPETAAGQGDGYSVPVQEIEYVRTFAHIAQVQLRSVLDALAREVDRLGHVPRLADAEPADASWDPIVPGPRPGS